MRASVRVCVGVSLCVSVHMIKHVKHTDPRGEDYSKKDNAHNMITTLMIT